ncbi:MAG: hypothetical protein N3E52_06685 [Candidatus Bathyarchaeota archaeon]|nr:hypothetical protein [Candidatus Bathyarchaeota archaeon]
MKLESLVAAVALYAVLQVLFAFPLTIAALQFLGVTMAAHYSAGVAAVFLSMLVVGCFFSTEIQQAPREAIWKIAVLSAFYELIVVVFQPTLADWIPFAISKPKEAFDGTVVTTVEWFLYNLSRRGNMFPNIVIIISLGIFGLYAGVKLKQTLYR